MDIKKRFNLPQDLTVDRLITTLTNARIADKNNALYQTIYGLIKNLGKLDKDTQASVNSIQNTISGGGSGGGGGGGIINSSYVTVNNEQALFPSSRQLIAGANITIVDNGTQIEISSSSVAALDYVVMSDGGIPNAQPLNDGAGSFIYIPYVP